MPARKDRLRPSFEVQDGDDIPIEEEEISPRDPAVAYLGMPDDAAFRTIVVPGRGRGEKWSKYTYEGVGVIMPDLPQPGVPCWVWEFGEIILFWRRRVYLEGTPLYIEGLYHPLRGETIHIPFIERDPRPKVLPLVANGLGLLRDVETRGRPLRERPVSLEDAKKEQRKVKKVIRKKLENGEAYNRRDIELIAYGEEQGGKYLAQQIHPAKYNDLEREVLRSNPSLIKAKRRNVLR